MGKSKKKRCSGCGKWKLRSEFSMNIARRDGIQSTCKSCSSKGQRNYRHQNKERRKNTDCLYRYGITYDQKLQLLEDQDNLCAICCRPLLSEEACIDHDHRTGKVRGILCRDCNVALGLFRDSDFVLEKAIKYLSSGKSA